MKRSVTNSDIIALSPFIFIAHKLFTRGNHKWNNLSNHRRRRRLPVYIFADNNKTVKDLPGNVDKAEREREIVASGREMPSGSDGKKKEKKARPVKK